MVLLRRRWREEEAEGLKASKPWRREKKEEEKRRTRIFNSGKPPSIFLSHTRSQPFQLSSLFVSGATSASCFLSSHTRNRPPVSGAFRGTRVIALRPGEEEESAEGRKVRKSSVCVQTARWSPTRRVAISINPRTGSNSRGRTTTARAELHHDSWKLLLPLSLAQHWRNESRRVEGRIKVGGVRSGSRRGSGRL